MKQKSSENSIFGTATTVPVAGKLLGLSRSKAYEAAARGEIPTLRFGRRLVVPTAPLRRMLGIEDPRPAAKESVEEDSP
jgi:excisionase family DNA binding protein